MELMPHSRAGGKPARLHQVLIILILVVAALHLGQSILVSGGRSIPGDMGDTRLNNGLLEHGFAALCGKYPWLSPGQFYPTPDTLTYSENLWGTLPFYIPFRWLGMGIESAFQAWIITWALFNAAAVFLLLRSLAIRPMIAAFLSFVATSSSALVFKMGHAQMLPFSPFVLALIFGFKFLRNSDPVDLAWAALLCAYQLACCVYLGFFAFIIVGLLLLIGLTVRVRSGTRPAGPGVRRWLIASGMIALAVCAALAVLYPYAAFAARSGTRPMQELIFQAPSFGAWFSASPDSLLYSHQSFLAAGSPAIEKTFFAGWILWILTGVAVWRLPANIRHHDAISSALVLTVLAILFGFTCWHAPDGSLFLKLAEHFAPLRAFRASGRIAYLVIVLQAVLSARILTGWADRLTLRGSQFVLLPACVALAMVLEGVSAGQFSYSKDEAIARSEGLVREFQQMGNRGVLVFCPGSVNQPNWAIHLDAWMAALRIRGRCLNGYSGNLPDGYGDFFWQPSEKNAKSLIGSLGIDESRFVFVRQWPRDIEEKYGIRHLDFSGGVTISTSAAHLTLAPMQRVDVDVVVHNLTDQEIPCDSLGLFPSYRAYAASGQLVDDPPSLRSKVGVLGRHADVSIKLSLQAPRQRGTYAVRLSMVLEGGGWWADRGFGGDTIILQVN